MRTFIGEKKLFKDFSKWEMLNLKPEDILDIPKRLHDHYRVSQESLASAMDVYGIQSTSKEVLEKEFDLSPMNYFLADSRHYS